MLAVLACILDEPRTLTKSLGRNSLRLNSDQRFQGHQSYGKIYYPSEEVAIHNLKILLPSKSSPLVDSQKLISGLHSATSSVGPMNSMSTSETPPSQSKPSRMIPEPKIPQSTNLSTSHEQYRHTHRSNSNLSALAASFSRPFSFGSAAPSPPNSYPKKRSSPVGTYLGNAAPTVTWSPSGLLGRLTTDTEDPKSSSLSMSDAENDVVPAPKKPIFKTKLKNQDQFLNDSYANVPLLDPSREWRYHAYREVYAHLLYVWDMPIARAEILNHNRPLQTDATPVTFARKATASFDALTGVNLLNSGYTTENSNPVFRDHCPYCSTLLLPSRTPSIRCQNEKCTKLPPAPLCLLCNASIRGLSSPCSNCGHILHASCRQLLSQASVDECPAACGCICADYATMPLPLSSLVEPSDPLAGVVSRHRRDWSADVRSLAESITVIGDDEGVDKIDDDGAHEREQQQHHHRLKEQGWEDVAYESLARNLRSSAPVRGNGGKGNR